jgi:biotin transport system substrate-specific component
MLRTIERTRDISFIQRLAGIALFTLLTVITAKLTLEIGPVPVTLQLFAVLLSGMVLGARDGMLSQLSYVALIAVGFPFDARGLGTAALLGPTAGYLVGFIFAAGIAGLLVEKGANRVWQRWLAGVAGITVLYVFGLLMLKNFTGMDWDAAWQAGVVPFLGIDLIKALVAAAITESSRTALMRLLNPKN